MKATQQQEKEFIALFLYCPSPVRYGEKENLRTD